MIPGFKCNVPAHRPLLSLCDGMLLTSKEVGAGNIFMVDMYRNISDKAWTDEEKVIAGIKQSSVLTDNFLSIYGGSQLDWFSDEDWVVVGEDQPKNINFFFATGCNICAYP